MRRIDPSSIIQGQSFRYKRGTFEHLNQALQEQAVFLVGAALPTLSVTPGVMTAISGMNLTSTTVPVGAILYEGAGGTVNIPTYVWGASGNIAATSVTNWYTDIRTSWFWSLDNGNPTGPELLILPGAATGVNSSTPVWLVTGSYPVNPDADPVTFSNGNSLYVHQTRYLQVCEAADIDFSPFANQGYAFQLGTVNDIVLAWQATDSVYTNSAGVATNTSAIAAIDGAWTKTAATITTSGGTVIGTPSGDIKWHSPGKTMSLYYNISLAFSGSWTTGDLVRFTIPGANTTATGLSHIASAVAFDGSNQILANAEVDAGTTTILLSVGTTATTGGLNFQGELTFDVQ